jgi:hypothetical protein
VCPNPPVLFVKYLLNSVSEIIFVDEVQDTLIHYTLQLNVLVKDYVDAYIAFTKGLDKEFKEISEKQFNLLSETYLQKISDIEDNFYESVDYEEGN